jgi:hypothetical protein
MVLAKRLPARKISYRKRHLALSSHDQVTLRKLTTLCQAVVLKIHRDNLPRSSPYWGHLKKLYALKLAVEYCEVDPTVQEVDTQIFDRTLDSFSEADARLLFAFQKSDLVLIYSELKFPQFCILSNGQKLSGEEVFLRSMYELVTGENQEKICRILFGRENSYELVTGENQEKICRVLFGRENSCQSRCFDYFIDHIFSNFSHLLTNNLDWWYRNGFTAASAQAIGAKMGQAPGVNMVAYFIDCNCLPTSVVGGGPAEAGANAARWDDLVQRAFYNDWKSVHGLKHQTVDDAFGFTEDMYGPTSLCRNDLTLLRKSNINGRLDVLQANAVLQYIVMGGSVYRTRSHITSYLIAADNIDGYVAWNRQMKKVRKSIVWNYGHTATLFKYLQNKRKMKLLASTTVSKVYTVCTLLRNLHIGCYGCQTANYFNLDIPANFVHHYLNQTDF